MASGKELGPDIFGFSKGGKIGIKKHGLGDILDPLGINDILQDIGKLLDPLGVGDAISDWKFSKIWEWLRELPLVGDTVKRGDKIVYPFVRDAIDPDKKISAETFSDMIEQMYDGLLDELWEQIEAAATGGASVLDDIFHTGTPFVKKTGPAVVEAGERIISAVDNRELINFMRNSRSHEPPAASSMPAAAVGNFLTELEKGLPSSDQSDIKVVLNDIFDILRRWETDGMPQERTYTA